MKDEVIAVDLGGTFMRVATVKGKKILKYVKKETPKTRNGLVNLLLELISEHMNKNVKGIGIASAGPIKSGVITNPPNLPFKRLDLKGIVKKKFKIKVEAENDAACVALAEAKLGIKKEDFFILTLGTGIGGGIILDGKLESGEGYGGELGHIWTRKNKDFEDVWQDIRKRYKKAFGEKTLIRDLFKINNRKSKKFIDEVSACLGQGIASLIAVFDPEIVIIAGGVRECGGKFMRKIVKQVKKYNENPRTPPIKWSTLDHPGILGASLLIK